MDPLYRELSQIAYELWEREGRSAVRARNGRHHSWPLTGSKMAVLPTGEVECFNGEARDVSRLREPKRSEGDAGRPSGKPDAPRCSRDKRPPTTRRSEERNQSESRRLLRSVYASYQILNLFRWAFSGREKPLRLKT